MPAPQACGCDGSGTSSASSRAQCGGIIWPVGVVLVAIVVDGPVAARRLEVAVRPALFGLEPVSTGTEVPELRPVFLFQVRHAGSGLGATGGAAHLLVGVVGRVLDAAIAGSGSAAAGIWRRGWCASTTAGPAAVVVAGVVVVAAVVDLRLLETDLGVRAVPATRTAAVSFGGVDEDGASARSACATGGLRVVGIGGSDRRGAAVIVAAVSRGWAVVIRRHVLSSNENEKKKERGCT
ncbi:hypothetical protein PG985_002714 [Apiospora marii]|uniref:uncharacterized protein n=1 Tax=Apiospora marii TaxID=335849 RepID=UPI0031303F91